MQLSINYQSGWISASKFKPFLLLGVGGLSSVALYTPLSSQAKELGNKLDTEAIKKVSPISNKLINGSSDLFNKLGEWAKYSTNKTGDIKDWAKTLQNTSIENGAKQIYNTLKDWVEKIYAFLKDLLSENVWEKFKNNVKKLGNFLNLLKNLMKLEIGGKASIFNEILSKGGGEDFDKFTSALGNIVDQNPEMGEEEVNNLLHAFKEKPKETAEMMEKFASNSEQKPNMQELMNAVEPAALVSKIKAALEKAKEFDNRDSLNKDSEEHKRAEAVYKELGELSVKLKELISKAEEKRKKK